MPRDLSVDKKMRLRAQRERRLANKRAQTWSEEDRLVWKGQRIIKSLHNARKYAKTVLPRSVKKNFFRKLDKIMSSRVSRQQLEDVRISIDFPETEFYSLVYPHMHHIHYRFIHIGDWSVPRFTLRIIGDFAVKGDTSLILLRKVFGSCFTKPRRTADLSGYNGDPKAGPLRGWLNFINVHKKVEVSYNDEYQRLNLSFSYFSCKWITSGDGGVQLEPVNRMHKNAFGDSSCGRFPLYGLKVKIYWPAFRKVYVAIVHEYSEKLRQWVLRYPEDGSTYYEDDTPLYEWEFI